MNFKDLLEKRKRQLSTTPEEDRKCCPNCGSITIEKRVMNKWGSEKKYRCQGDCGQDFDVPMTKGEYDERV